LPKLKAEDLRTLMHPCRAVASAVVLVGLVSLPATHQTDATRTPIDGPCALAIDRAGHLFIGSLYEDNVRRIDLETGKIKLVAGNGKTCCYKEDAKAVNVSLDAVWALAVNSAGDLFIGETKTIRKVDTKTGRISTVGDLLRSPTTFSQIWGLAVDSDDNLFVADRAQGKLFKIELANGAIGSITPIAGNGKYGFAGDDGPAMNAEFSGPSSMAFDQNGNLLVADESNCRIRRIDRQTGIISTAVMTETLSTCSTEAKNPLALLPSPTDLAVDSEGRIVFTEEARNLVKRADKNAPTLSIIAGTGDRNFSGDGGPAVDATFSAPRGVVFDSKGNLYVADISNNRVRRIGASTKKIETVAGNGGPNVIHGEE
jgi:sugar lactone lactonase YvrE